ncbi:hypothetical protein SLEP1_g4412 [Rubroshorea leprosula]|uniref:Uncharacterized protein n=1 Tax=Rubroshorea leprosula TaxID=152421 RepID=A0AAV5HV13_9ROSI|nr:hypothetical protein SLEP1_g4412 [Rubroshorea leprosula]
MFCLNIQPETRFDSEDALQHMWRISYGTCGLSRIRFPIYPLMEDSVGGFIWFTDPAYTLVKDSMEPERIVFQNLLLRVLEQGLVWLLRGCLKERERTKGASIGMVLVGTVGVSYSFPDAEMPLSVSNASQTWSVKTRFLSLYAPHTLLISCSNPSQDKEIT